VKQGELPCVESRPATLTTPGTPKEGSGGIRRRRITTDDVRCVFLMGGVDDVDRLSSGRRDDSFRCTVKRAVRLMLCNGHNPDALARWMLDVLYVSKARARQGWANDDWLQRIEDRRTTGLLRGRRSDTTDPQRG